ncbi:protein starmaker-like isoform X2 [Drosophila obscura]|uniref:protein starmaker-like isoform X2 n=1 Tax=Drosophila obscura TaxID=7282 RepID=UPI000BA0A423|nr:protein starmaker-like isoform X2 [Drosophila obscura]
MVMDLEHICRDAASSSSSSTNIFCNIKNRCSPCRCYRCCTSSFLNDHTYSLLKRICHKIIKSHSRQQCRENYSVFDGGSLKDLGWQKRRSEGKIRKDCRREGTDERKLKPTIDLGPLNKSLRDKGINEEEFRALKISKKGSNKKKQLSAKGKSEDRTENSDKPSQDTDASIISKKSRKEKGRKDKENGNTDKDDSKKSVKEENEGEHIKGNKDKRTNGKTKSQNNKSRGAKDKGDTDNKDTDITESGKSRKDKRGKDDDKESGNIDGDEAKISRKQTGKNESRKSDKDNRIGNKDNDDSTESRKSRKDKDSKKGKAHINDDDNNQSASNSKKDQGEKDRSSYSKDVKSKSKKGEYKLDDEVDNNETGGKKMKNEKSKGKPLGKGAEDSKSKKDTSEDIEEKSIDKNVINSIVDKGGSKKKDGSYSGDDAKKLNKSKSDGLNESSAGRESVLKRKGVGSDRKKHGGSTPNISNFHKKKKRRSSRQSAFSTKVESKSGVRFGIKGSKNIQMDGPSSRSELYMQSFLRPSRCDEVRPCDILRTQLEQRDLSRFFHCCPRNNCRMCSPCCLNAVTGTPCCGNFGT